MQSVHLSAAKRFQMVGGKLGKTSRRMKGWLEADFNHQLFFAQGGGPIFEQIIVDSFSYAGRHNGIYCCKREEAGAAKRSLLLLAA